jgi:hypothetical protein
MSDTNQAGKGRIPENGRNFKKHNSALYWRSDAYKDKRREQEQEAQRELINKHESQTKENSPRKAQRTHRNHQITQHQTH